MVKATKILALTFAVLMVVSLFAACGGGSGYDGTYDLVEAKASGMTITKEQLKASGNVDGDISITIDGDKATFELGSKKEEMTFDSEKMTMTNSKGESKPVKFDDDKLTLTIDGVEMIFEK